MATLFKLNGKAIKTPSSFKDEFYDITKSNRLQNGMMTIDMIAKKTKFYLGYDYITTEEKDVIYDIVWKTWNPFMVFEYLDDDGLWKKHTVYAGALSKKAHRVPRQGSWVWVDFELRLIEQ